MAVSTGVPVRQTPLARRLTWVLFSAQALGSAGFIAAATIASVAGAELSGRESWAGMPSAAFLLGSAVAAFFWGLVMEALGRRTGLVLGLWTGVFGALIAAWAIIEGSFVLLLLGLPLMGSAQAALQLGRFAAAEVSPPPLRGRAIANVVLGGTVGAILGPLLVGPMGAWSRALGFPEVTGAYGASAGMFLLALAVVFSLLRPDPRDVGRQLSAEEETPAEARVTRPLGVILRQRPVVTAIAAMVFGQMVMVMLMVITALHMTHHHHALTSISAVISSHTLGMYAFSVLSGQLTDRWGRVPVILLGAGTLLLSCLLAPLSPAVLPLAVALFLLGLGWNFCFVGGSSLLSDHLSPAERSRTQGVNDLLLGLASATGSLGSGVVFATVGFGAMALVGAVVALVPLGLTLWWAGVQRRAVGA